MTRKRRIAFGLLVLLFSYAVPVDGSGQSVSALALEETSRVDGYAMDLVSVRHAVQGPDGSVVISQPMDATLRQFLKDGRAGWTAGGAGDGPGEFRTMSTIGRLADAIWVVDGRSGRISFFDSSGQLVRDERLPHFANSGDVSYGFVGPLAAYDDGSYLAVLGLRTPKEDPNLTEYDRTTYARVDSKGTIVNMVAATASTRGFFVKTGSGASGAVLPFQHRTYASASENGAYLAVATPRMDGDDAWINVEVLLPSGDTLFTSRVAASPERVPPERWKEAVRRGATQFSAALSDEYAKQAEKNAPRVFPFVEGVHVTNEGRVWLSLRATGETRRHLLLGQNGSVAGSAELPAMARAVAAFGDTFVTVEKDEYDVESVVRYEIVHSR